MERSVPHSSQSSWRKWWEDPPVLNGVGRCFFARSLGDMTVANNLDFVALDGKSEKASRKSDPMIGCDTSETMKVHLNTLGKPSIVNESCVQPVV